MNHVTALERIAQLEKMLAVLSGNHHDVEFSVIVCKNCQTPIVGMACGPTCRFSYKALQYRPDNTLEVWDYAVCGKRRFERDKVYRSSSRAE